MERIEVIPTAGIAPEHAVPGSKSYTNRALPIAAMADGRSTLRGALVSDDTRVARAALESLGIKVDFVDGTFAVHGLGGRFNEPEAPLFLGNSGTATRFLTAMMTLQGFPSIITGNERMQERPIADLLVALNELGAEVVSERGQRLSAGAHWRHASAGRPGDGFGRHQQPVSLRPSHGCPLRHGRTWSWKSATPSCRCPMWT